MTKDQRVDMVKFIEAARIVRYKPTCAITTHMTLYDIEDMTEEELVEEALELNKWLNGRQFAFFDKNRKEVFVGDDCTITIGEELIGWGEVEEVDGAFYIDDGAYAVSEYLLHIELDN